MTQSEDSKIIGIMHLLCCGLDVHKESISACVIYPDENGLDRYDIKVFGTFTDDLMRLRKQYVHTVGDYRKRTHKLFESANIKIDDAVKSQFSPPLVGGDEGEGEITDGNTVTYHPLPNPPPSRGREFRTFYIVIKIDSVVSDLFGATGRNLMNLLVSDRKSLTLSDIQLCVRGKLKGREEELYRSIQGFFSDHHRFILAASGNDRYAGGRD